MKCQNLRADIYHLPSQTGSYLPLQVTIDLELHIPKAKFRGSVSHYDIYLCRVPRSQARSPKLNPDGAKQRVLRWDDHRHTSSPRPCSVCSPNSLSDPFSGQLRWARADTPSSCMF
ncbi:hypothetical protein WMY93_024415 [Mugilogobius chulae]|uniref:Uncharacterized protein n=1 Tax=Mugilogobius chulae TaxID=88201 RepID=A0AAW0N4D2_9GOBI